MFLRRTGTRWENVTNYQRNSSTPSSGRGRGAGGKGGKGIPRCKVIRVKQQGIT